MTPRHAAALLAVLLWSACADMGPDTEGLRDEIAAHRARWQARRPASYVYEVERICFCAETARGPARVRVRGADVVERTYTASGAPVPSEMAELFPSVDGLFDVLEDAVERKAWQILVTWDPESGAPLDFYIDYDTRTVDEEVSIRMIAAPAPDPGT